MFPIMAERKNMHFDRPGGYAMPTGATHGQRRIARELAEADIRLYGDSVAPHNARTPDHTVGGANVGGPKPGQSEGLPQADRATPRVTPAFLAPNPDTALYVGDCRDILAALPEKGSVDLVFADPPFNWEVPYAGDGESGGGWKDGMPRAEYERFTFDWLDGCIDALAPHGSIFVNIPDDTAAEAVIHLKRRGLTMINWCIWHFRFGQHRDSSFIMSKVHVLYFAKDPATRIWNGNDILELSDRASIYGDKRTMEKDNNKGMRVPMDVWYGKYWGRIQGNNKERRHNHHNQIPEVYLERVIRCASNVGDLVLDPFCGSGTTSTVARALGRRSITIEYSAVNAKSAWERITKVGMVKREDNGPQSSAIFGKRGRKSRSVHGPNGTRSSV
jgi:DNA modification methylase